MSRLMLEDIDSPCKADTEYESVVIIGNARVVEDIGLKRMILREITKKYLPQDPNMPIPENMFNGTAVVEVSIERITGKYHK